MRAGLGQIAAERVVKLVTVPEFRRGIPKAVGMRDAGAAALGTADTSEGQPRSTIM